MNLPKKKARIFSNDGSRARSRAVVFNATNYFNGDSTNDEFNFSEPIAPVSSQASQIDDSSRIRKAHQCHESGESNQLDKDIEYFIEGLDKKHNTNYRCLHLLGLAEKIMSVEYRMHLRAHEVMPKIMTHLDDAPGDPSLALSCATLMFIHNQDKTSLDIDELALKLLLDLITGGEKVHSNANVEKKHKDRILELIAQMKDNGHAKHLETKEITAANLAIETLLGLNSKRAGDWFKNELRRLKGVDFILDTIANIAQTEDLETNDALLDKLEQCMHILENITFQNKCNQEYMIKYNDGVLIDSCLELLTLYKREIAVSVSDAQSKQFTAALFTTIRVLNNITSENETSSIIGSRDEFTDLILYIMHELQTFIDPEQRYLISMTCVCLLINMVEYSKHLRSYLMGDSTRIHDLIDTFYKQISEAQRIEHQSDQILDSYRREKRKTEAMQETILTQVEQKAGGNMEHIVVAALLAILFGCIIQDNNDYRERLISYLRQKSVAPLVDAIKKLQELDNLRATMTKTGVDRLRKVLAIFKMN